MYRWLSNILGQWEPSQAERFCRFATSSRQVPTDFNFNVINYSGGLERVPVAHTCFSTVDVPNYSDEATLKAGLEKALEFSDIKSYQLA